ncbi:MAG: S8 family serine peptidase [Cyclobacteriaceae bacterium]
MKYILLLWACLTLSLGLLGQKKSVWLYLNEDVEYKTMLDLERDRLGDHHYSRWLHAIGTRLEEKDIQQIVSLEMISQITVQQLFTYQKSLAQEPKMGFALEQIGAELFLERGLDGDGVSIGVIDGGFLNADKIEPLADLFESGSIKAYRDYITPDLKPYEGIKALDDRHGTDVLQLIGGKSIKTGIIHGLATASDYYLARTDHGAYEKKIEEVYLVQALEWMDSLEIKLVNISLGYTEGFENTSDNYRPVDINGTSAISRAVHHASDQEGMLIIISAGNDGDRNWRVLSTPADARGALTVGATKFRHWDKMAFSSVGPDELPYLKPEISCFASEGTSFSAPIITGMAALVWQALPHLTNEEVKDMVLRSGHLYPFGNNYVGYGVPVASRIIEQLDGKSVELPERIKVYKDTYRLTKKCKQHYVVYQKADKWRVLSESYTRVEGIKPKIKRLDNASFTTVIMDNTKVYELQWMKE